MEIHGGFLGNECECVFVERAAGEVGGFGQAVGEVRDGVDAAADAVGHGAGLAAPRANKGKKVGELPGQGKYLTKSFANKQQPV